MREPNFDLIPQEQVDYFGASDLLAQIADELRNNPDSCFSKNVFAWYNRAYAQQNDFSTCEYQVDVDKQVCIDKYGDPEDNEQTIGSTLDFLISTAVALGRRDGRRLVLNFCRLARRALVERLARRV